MTQRPFSLFRACCLLLLPAVAGCVVVETAVDVTATAVGIAVDVAGTAVSTTASVATAPLRDDD